MWSVGHTRLRRGILTPMKSFPDIPGLSDLQSEAQLQLVPVSKPEQRLDLGPRYFLPESSLSHTRHSTTSSCYNHTLVNYWHGLSAPSTVHCRPGQSSELRLEWPELERRQVELAADRSCIVSWWELSRGLEIHLIDHCCAAQVCQQVDYRARAQLSQTTGPSAAGDQRGGRWSTRRRQKINDSTLHSTSADGAFVRGPRCRSALRPVTPD